MYNQNVAETGRYKKNGLWDGQLTTAGPGCNLENHDIRWFYPTTGLKPLKFIFETFTNHVKCLTSKDQA